MGIFDRLATLLKSNINDLISKAENPEKMLDQIVTDMRNQLARAKQQVAAAIAAATCCFARASELRISTTIWSNIFSGFSAFEIRSLMFDFNSVASRSKIPIVSAPRGRWTARGDGRRAKG